MMITINFLRIETLRRNRMSTLLVLAAAFHDSRQVQQLGTDFQPRLLSCRKIDLELNLGSDANKADDATLVDELRRLTDGQDVGAFQWLQDQRQRVPFRRADKQNMAGFEFLDLPVALHDQFVLAPTGRFFAAKFQRTLKSPDFDPSPVYPFLFQLLEHVTQRVLS